MVPEILQENQPEIQSLSTRRKKRVDSPSSAGYIAGFLNHQQMANPEPTITTNHFAELIVVKPMNISP